MRVLRTNSWTAKEILNFKMIFKLFDQDGSDEISVNELMVALTSLGCKPTQEDLDVLLKECDTDGSGEISFSEFLLMLAKLNNYGVGGTGGNTNAMFHRKRRSSALVSNRPQGGCGDDDGDQMSIDRRATEQDPFDPRATTDS